MKLLGMALVLAASAAACSPRRGEPLNGSVPVDDAQVENGRTIFMQHCNVCHPGGEAGVGPALNSTILPKFAKKFQVRHGLGKMPKFSKNVIDKQQLDDLMSYLTALRRYDERREAADSR